MDTNSYVSLRQDAEFIAKKAGTLLKSMQQTSKIAVQKDAVDIATTADLASEKLISDFIRKKYPTHAIYSEEAGGSRVGEWVWYIDPLDGTKEYIRGSTEYNCLIAVEHNGKLVAGVIHRNGTGENYAASAGNGAFLNSMKLVVSEVSDVTKSMIGFHIPSKSSGQPKIESQILLMKKFIYACYRVRPGWDDAKLLGWVARGIVDAHIIPAGLKNEWHDLAPGLLLVIEAGGTVMDWYGNPIKNHDISKGLVASNGNVHNKIIDIISRIV